MKILLTILGVLFFLAAGGVTSVSKGAIHEIEALLLILIAIGCISTASILGALEKLAIANKKRERR